MGLRFECPNGHRLNVKAFLAGKRGICPHCDVKFIVPETSGGRAVRVDVAGEPETSEALTAAPRTMESATPSVDLDSVSDSAATIKIEAPRSVGSFSARNRHSRTGSRRDRARKLTVALGAFVLLLAVALALVLWS